MRHIKVKESKTLYLSNYSVKKALYIHFPKQNLARVKEHYKLNNKMKRWK